MLLRAPTPIAFPPFRQRFPWIGADLQTLRNTIRGPGTTLSDYASERLMFPCNDGSGDVLQGALNTPHPPTTKPLVILIHGLTGSEDSSHQLMSADYFLSLGHPVLRLNQRGAGPSRETCRGHYHAGRSEDLASAMNGLPPSLCEHGVVMMALSLGGNVLLKFLADYPRFPAIKAAVAVSPPVDLAAAQRQIMASSNRVYHHHLLKQMKNGADWSDFIEKISPDILQKITTIYDFDDQIIAPANGFADAPDYYAQCSSLPLLDAIDTPTLIIHPADDPWVPIDPLLARAWDEHAPGYSHVFILAPENGGHIGCHGKGSKVPWQNLCAEIFFAQFK